MSRSPLRRCWIKERCAVRDAAPPPCARARRLAPKVTAPKRPRSRVAAKGIATPAPRRRLRRRHSRPVIPTRKDQPRQRNFDREAYRLRNNVERLINRLKQARRVAPRYEKRGDNYLAMVHIGMILLWLKPFADTA